MRTPVTDRGREIARIQGLLERLHAPRLQMMLIVALTGAAGFLASFVLLHAGVDSLRLRYPVAVAMAYAAFLFFLWFWLRWRRADFLDSLDLPIPDSSPSASAFEPGGGEFGGGGASSSFADGPEVSGAAGAAAAFDSDELAVVLVAIVALVGAVGAALWIVWGAPALLAELLLDVALSAGLYRRLRTVHGDHWLRTAIRRTGWPFVAVALLFALAGAVMQAYAPGARSLGQVIQHYTER